MRLVYNSNSTMHLPVLHQIRLARETGWDGIFLREEHIRRYLAEGYSMASLRDALAGLEPVNLGAVADVERWRPRERSAMLSEAEALTRVAVDVGASYVQLLTGPVQPGGRYAGPGKLSVSDREKVTAEALRAVADLGAAHGIRYDLEPKKPRWRPSTGPLRPSRRRSETTSASSWASGICGRSARRPRTSPASTR